MRTEFFTLVVWRSFRIFVLPGSYNASVVVVVVVPHLSVISHTENLSHTMLQFSQCLCEMVSRVRLLERDQPEPPEPPRGPTKYLRTE